jgi:sialic acid synthase SpsE
MVQAIRNVEEALGSGEKKPADCERVNIAVARRSLIASRAIAKGETFTCKNLLIRRASGGLSPMRYWDLLGTEAKRDYRAEELVSE